MLSSKSKGCPGGAQSLVGSGNRCSVVLLPLKLILLFLSLTHPLFMNMRGFFRLGGSFVERFWSGEMFGLVKLAFLCLPRFLACQCHVSGGSLFPGFRECPLLSPHTVIARCDCRAGLIPIRGEPGRRDKWEVGVRPPHRTMQGSVFWTFPGKNLSSLGQISQEVCDCNPGAMVTRGGPSCREPPHSLARLSGPQMRMVPWAPCLAGGERSGWAARAAPW